MSTEKSVFIDICFSFVAKCQLHCKKKKKKKSDPFNGGGGKIKKRIED